MKFKITPNGAILSLKYWLLLIVCWPPSLDATRKTRILHNIAWCIALFFPLHSVPGLLWTTWLGSADAAQVTKIFAECITMITTVAKMIISKCHQSRLQVACAEMENFVNTAGPREKAKLEHCIDRCGTFYAFFQFTCIIASTSFSCGPLILSQPFPSKMEYPFEWRNLPNLRVFLYFTQIVAVYQASSALVIDMQLAFLLWVVGLRFELLAEDFENAHSRWDFHECIKKHQQLITSVSEITIYARYLVMNVIINTAMTNLCCAYQFVTHQPFEVIFQFFLLFSLSSVEVAMLAWPADTILTVSENIGLAVYYSPWVGASREVMNEINIVSIRSQKPLVIAVDGILSKLNLDFYGKYATTSFSYFTTLRAIIG